VPRQLSGAWTSKDELAGQSASSSTSAATRLPSGIWELAGDLVRLSGKLHTLNDELFASEGLTAEADKVRSPLVDRMRGLIRKGDEVSTAADTAGPAALAQQKQQLDALTAQFRQTSTQLPQLSKMTLLLGMQQASLRNWKESVRDEMHENFRQLLLKLAVLAVLVGLVFGLGEVWRRATFRYVHDGRRRYQFLL